MPGGKEKLKNECVCVCERGWGGYERLSGLVTHLHVSAVLCASGMCGNPQGNPVRTHTHLYVCLILLTQQVKRKYKRIGIDWQTGEENEEEDSDETSL